MLKIARSTRICCSQVPTGGPEMSDLARRSQGRPRALTLPRPRRGSRACSRLRRMADTARGAIGAERHAQERHSSGGMLTGITGERRRAAGDDTAKSGSGGRRLMSGSPSPVRARTERGDGGGTTCASNLVGAHWQQRIMAAGGAGRRRGGRWC
jgi:hypothetical protein